MKTGLDSPELFFNRELSWLEFNQRVLNEGRAEDVPLMERLKFLSIVGSNLDEFFMIRVAGLKQQAAAGVTVRDISGRTAGEQLELISRRVHRMVEEHAAAIRDVTDRLAPHGLRVVGMPQLSPRQADLLDAHFTSEVLPLLTPLATDQLEPFPVLRGLGLNLALMLKDTKEAGEAEHLAIVPIPGNLSRFVRLPENGELRLIPLEQLVRWHVGKVFADHKVEAAAVFRVTRDGDVLIDDDTAGDLIQAVEEAVRSRRRRAVVRLELSADPDPRIKKWLMKWGDVTEPDIYEVDGLLDASALMEIARTPGFGKLKVADWRPQPARDLAGRDDLWTALQERDVLLFHPYESFQPVISLIEAAASDPKVLAIKQTLYRTSGDSPIVAALASAAESGKQVAVLVELKARFDEAQNAGWARRLEDAGCHVIYGIAGYKTHAKLLLIIRREAHGVRRYLHMSTGNYHDRTAKLYSDIGFMTTDREFTSDAAAFFNLLTGYSQEVGWSRFAVSPRGLRQRFVELIEREAEAATMDRPGLIMAKVNSLEDKGICQALYRASKAGVKILLNVRGLCCLRPAVEGVSENIEVVSVVDRFLEHARVFYFHNGGHEEVYLSSADWMRRNIDRRLEVMFPVLAPALSKRVKGILETFFADNVKAWRLLPDGTYERVQQSGPRARAQEEFYRSAVEAAHAEDHEAAPFRPLTGPQERSGS